MKLLSVASALAGVSVLLVDPVLADIKATDVMHTIASGKDGNCDGWALDTMVHEAINLNDKAISALDAVTKPKGFSLKENRNIAEMTASMWGVQVQKTLLDLSGDSYYFDEDALTLLNKVKSNYKRVNDKLKDTSNKDNGKLSCGPKDWAYKKKWGDMGPRFVNPHSDLPNQGLFLSKEWSQKDDKGNYILEKDKSYFIKAVEGETNRLEDGVCGKGLVGFCTGKYITLCDIAKKKETLADLLGQQDSFPKGQDVTHLNTTGTHFHHEMFHLIDEDIIDQPIGGSEAYMWGNCMALAKQARNSKDKPEQKTTVLNADTYRLYATAAFFSHINWGVAGRKPTEAKKSD